MPYLEKFYQWQGSVREGNYAPPPKKKVGVPHALFFTRRQIFKSNDFLLYFNPLFFGVWGPLGKGFKKIQQIVEISTYMGGGRGRIIFY